ncbi:MAG: sugar ABC transporter substrate-binding protein [Ardenticatenales bacterium]|nr:sugar ABC transporter substrate-binding protein [Ardenticatenales bacterium]MCB9171870.1 sugar ABC transporter substrate-binding protein [Ardenticatenales bacterium]
MHTVRLRLILLLLSLLIVACGTAATTPESESGAANDTPSGDPISFAVFGDQAELSAFEAVVAAFEAEYPEIDIEIQHTASQSDYRQRLATSFSAGSPPDIFLLNYRRFGQFVSQDVLEPLGPYLDQSDLIAADDFLPPTLDSFMMNGQLWCIPQNLSSLVIYYNKDLFDAAGVPYPSNDWTWEQFLETAKALTLDTDGDGSTDQYGVGIEASIFRLAPFVWQAGGEIVDDPANPTRLTLDTPEAQRAFKFYVALQTEHHVVPDRVAEQAEESEARFLNGTLAMYFNSRRGVPTYRTIESFAWDVAPLPQDVEKAGILHSDGYCLSSKAANKEGAWRFIEFANSVEGQTIVAASGRTVPSLRRVAESDAFLDPTLPPANSRIFIEDTESIRRVPIMETWVGIEETAGKEIEEAFYGTISTEEAAQRAQDLTQGYFDEVNGE